MHLARLWIVKAISQVKKLTSKSRLDIISFPSNRGADVTKPEEVPTTAVDSEVLTAVPLLPPELELQIFTLVARLDYTNIRKLLLVAKRVHEWLEPLLFESAFLFDSRISKGFFERAHQLGSSYLSSTTKTLFIIDDEIANQPGIKSCTGVQYLAICTSINLSQIEDFRPRRMNLQLSNIDLPRPEEMTYFQLPLFSQLTHLELYGVFHGYPFHLIPNLTHLSLNMWSTSPGLVALEVKRILETCERLEVILLLFVEHDEDEEREMVRKDLEGLEIEPRGRCLILYGNTQMISEDWNSYLRGEDPWETAANNK